VSAAVIRVDGLSVDFDVPAGFLRKAVKLHAVADVTLSIGKGDTLGIVGESGSGKSTLVNAFLNLQRPTRGAVRLDGVPVAELPRRAFARRVQPVFQDPYSSLNPHRTVADIVAQPLVIHAIGDRAAQRRAVEAMLERVGLPRRLAQSRARELSGGQRQRVAIARALVIAPEILICDEPTSALDVSVQAQILNLLQDLQRDLGLTLAVVSHNLAVIEHLATHVAVMYCGRVVEAGPAERFFAAPRHPYSVSLINSILTLDPGGALPDGLAGQPPNALELPPGCAFATRCARALPVCATERPAARMVDGIAVECHLYSTANAGTG
jgi:peptide/nickel transport system ATP-binding protein